jgi:glycerophosphoryl diester phosphodiesterase
MKSGFGMRKGLPIIVAHRGLHERLPENSVAAMEAAWDAGIEWCECDVQLSRDGAAVVIHDRTLRRTTTGHGRVADFTAAELKRLWLRDGEGKRTSHRVPMLDELLEMCGAGRRLLVETKPLMGKAICAIARKILRKRGMLHSFHVGDLLEARECTRGKCTVALLAHDLEVLERGFDGDHHVHHRSLRDGSRYDKFGVWTVNEQRAIRRMVKLGVRMLITDKPILAREILEAGI